MNPGIDNVSQDTEMIDSSLMEFYYLGYRKAAWGTL